MTEQELTDVRELAMAAIRATTPMALMDRENQRVIEQTVRAVPALVAEVRRLQRYEQVVQKMLYGRQREALEGA